MKHDHSYHTHRMVAVPIPSDEGIKKLASALDSRLHTAAVKAFEDGKIDGLTLTMADKSAAQNTFLGRDPEPELLSRMGDVLDIENTEGVILILHACFVGKNKEDPSKLAAFRFILSLSEDSIRGFQTEWKLGHKVKTLEEALRFNEGYASGIAADMDSTCVSQVGFVDAEHILRQLFESAEKTEGMHKVKQGDLEGDLSEGNLRRLAELAEKRRTFKELGEKYGKQDIEELARKMGLPINLLKDEEAAAAAPKKKRAKKIITPN